MMMESTDFLSSSTPETALSILRFASNVNGSVTTATVRIFMSLAILAMIGAAPVPVPPPMPAVINSKSVSFKTF